MSSSTIDARTNPEPTIVNRRSDQASPSRFPNVVMSPCQRRTPNSWSHSAQSTPIAHRSLHVAGEHRGVGGDRERIQLA